VVKLVQLRANIIFYLLSRLAKALVAKLAKPLTDRRGINPI